MNQINNVQLQYKSIWDAIDYLLTGDETFITELLRPYLDSMNDPHNALEKRIRNLWVPHEYAEEYRRITSKVMTSLFVSGASENSSFLPKNENMYSYFQDAFSHLINYGGVCTAIIPPSTRYNGYSLQHVAGKNIIDVCVNAYDASLEYISWTTSDREFDPSNLSVNNTRTVHCYYKVNGTVYYASERNTSVYDMPYFQHSSLDLNLGVATSFTAIPVTGTNTEINDDTIFRGTPYFVYLALSCLKTAFGAAKLDYLIDFVLPPILIHKGASLNTISNADWRGLNISPNEDVFYLQYDGPILKSGEAQLNRYSTGIKNQLPSTMMNSSSTAYEAWLNEENSNMIRTFLMPRYTKYCYNVIMLANQYGLLSNISANNFNIKLATQQYEPTNTNVDAPAEP